MANRYFPSQFNYSFERFPVSLSGSCAQTDAGAFATLVDNGITYLAVTMGSAGNSITVAIVADAEVSAGDEVVTVDGNAITVAVESGVSTRAQVETAIEANEDAAALISVSVASGGTAATLMAATALATGDDTDFTQVGRGWSLSQIGTGLYKISLEDSYKALLACNIMLQRASGAVDLMAQLDEVDVSDATDPSIIFRMQAAATPTNMANADVLYIDMRLRNSSQND